MQNSNNKDTVASTNSCIQTSPTVWCLLTCQRLCHENYHEHINLTNHLTPSTGAKDVNKRHIQLNQTETNALIQPDTLVSCLCEQQQFFKNAVGREDNFPFDKRQSQG